MSVDVWGRELYPKYHQQQGLGRWGEETEGCGGPGADLSKRAKAGIISEDRSANLVFTGGECRDSYPPREASIPPCTPLCGHDGTRGHQR